MIDFITVQFKLELKTECNWVLYCSKFSGEILHQHFNFLTDPDLGQR